MQICKVGLLSSPYLLCAVQCHLCHLCRFTPVFILLGYTRSVYIDLVLSGKSVACIPVESYQMYRSVLYHYLVNDTSSDVVDMPLCQIWYVTVWAQPRSDICCGGIIVRQSQWGSPRFILITVLWLFFSIPPFVLNHLLLTLELFSQEQLLWKDEIHVDAYMCVGAGSNGIGIKLSKYRVSTG